MSFITDFSLVNNASGTFTYSQWEPTDNTSSSTLPNYIEGTTCKFWPLSKTGGDGYCSVGGNSVSMTDRLLVGWFFQTFADIDNIPITALSMRIASDTALSANMKHWDILEQLNSPLNASVSGHVPIMAHQDSGTVGAGTPVYSTISNFGYYGTTGNDNDGKQGWFDMIFAIGYIGEESASYTTSNFFDQLVAESYDNDGGAFPQTNRPLGVISSSGSFYQCNVNIWFGSGSGDTAMTVVEEGKTVFFANVVATHNVGYVFKDPATGDLAVTLTNIGHSWAIKQTDSAAEIFTTPGNATTFKITGCSFSGGGAISLPADSALRWVRNTKFTNCEDGSASDGEFTDCILDSCLTMAISGDADFKGTQVLTPRVAADASGLEWNGTTDPDGQLDDMTFIQGTTDHHAIGFAATIPTEITLTNISFSGFNVANSHNGSTLYFADTTGTITVNLIGCTGTITYKSAGANIVFVVSPVTLGVTLNSHTGAPQAGAAVLMTVSSTAGGWPYEHSVAIESLGTIAEVTHTGHGLDDDDKLVVRGCNHGLFNGLKQITTSGANQYTYTAAGPVATVTGSPEVTFVIISGNTNTAGYVSDTRSYSANQPVEGWGRKHSGPPYYKNAPLSGTVDSNGGAEISAAFILDE